MASRIVSLIFLVLIAANLTLAVDLDQEQRVGKIRAALIYYIVKFIDFKANSLEKEHSAINICSVGTDPLNLVIQNIIKGKKSQNKDINVEFIPSIGKLQQQKQSCSIIFFGLDSVSKQYFYSTEASLIRELNENHILTVCASENINWQGCAIQIYEDTNKAKLAIDLEQIEKIGVKVGSELLEVSTVKKQ